MNNITITGNLTSDMEVTALKTIDIGNFIIANNVGYGDKKRTSFIRCTLFGKRVESMQKMLLKGAKVLINGYLETSSQKHKDGTYTNYTNIVVNEIEVLHFVDNKDNKTDEQQPDMTPVDDGNTPF